MIHKAENVMEVENYPSYYYQIGSVAEKLWFSSCQRYIRKIIYVRYLCIKQTWYWKVSSEY